jgi:hypothetical protein
VENSPSDSGTVTWDPITLVVSGRLSASTAPQFAQ